MTKTSRAFAWVIAGGLCAALAAVFLAGRNSGAKRLPAPKDYGGLPAAFGGALTAARNRAVASRLGAEDVRSLAHLYQANRLNGEARTCYNILGTSSGGLDARDHYYLSEIALYEGDLDQGEAELRATTLAAPQYLPARLALADVLFKSGQADAAEREYLGMLSIEANQPQAMFGLARIDLQRGNDASAITRLGALMVSHPEMTSGAALLAQVFERRGERERAAAMAQWSRQKPEPVPPDPWLDQLLADCYDLQRLALKFEEYFTSGELERAVPLLGRVEELDPKSPIPHLLRGWSQARDHNDLQAVGEYRLALDAGGDPEKICPYMVQSLLTLGKVADAAQLLAEVHAKKPESIPILVSYSEVAVRQGNVALARDLLGKVLQKEPNLYAANMNLAKILWNLGERDGAAECLVRVTRVSADDVPSRALLGEYYLGKSDPYSAIAPLEQAVAKDRGQTPSSRDLVSMLDAAYLGAGGAEEGKGRVQQAVADYYDKAIQLAPREPSAYARKAAACARLGQFQAAAEALEKLLLLVPRNPTVYLSLGDVLYHAGEKDRAMTNWREALRLAAPGDTALRAAIGARLDAPITEDTFR